MYFKTKVSIKYLALNCNCKAKNMLQKNKREDKKNETTGKNSKDVKQKQKRDCVEMTDIFPRP